MRRRQSHKGMMQLAQISRRTEVLCSPQGREVFHTQAPVRIHRAGL